MRCPSAPAAGPVFCPRRANRLQNRVRTAILAGKEGDALGERNVTLLCAAEDEQRCSATVLRDALRERLNKMQ